MLFTGEGGAEYGYEDGWSPDGLFLYSGEGPSGDMRFVRGNRAVRDHAADGKDLHLFEYVSKGHVRYVGQMVCVGFHERRGDDTQGQDRREIVFELAPFTEFDETPTHHQLDELEPAWQEPLHTLRERAIAYSSTAATPVERKSLVRQRSSAIRIYALRRAAGICEACGSPAPFKTSAGRPYLETHHIRRLSDGGPDDPQWVAALCPNCQRQAHHGHDSTEFNRRLTQTIHEQERRLGHAPLTT